jgi:hypothetical protein
MPRFHLLPRRRAGDPRASVLAFFVQLTLIAIVVPALIVPVAIDLLRDDSGGTVVPERISFQVLLPTDGATERRPPRDGGDGREVRPDAAQPEVPPIVAPTAVPATIPVPAEPRDPVGVGPLVGSGGPAQGIRPSFTDQRLWVAPSEYVTAPIVPLTRADTLRLMIQARAIALVDSLSRLPSDAGRQGDWTVDRNGKKYGIDQGFIRLGNFSIPTAVLAMLPMNVQTNPIAMERARRLDSMRGEIQEQAARSIRDDEFRKAVRALRERKERERREAEAAAKGPGPPTRTPIEPGER